MWNVPRLRRANVHCALCQRAVDALESFSEGQVLHCAARCHEEACAFDITLTDAWRVENGELPSVVVFGGTDLENGQPALPEKSVSAKLLR